MPPIRIESSDKKIIILSPHIAQLSPVLSHLLSDPNFIESKTFLVQMPFQFALLKKVFSILEKGMDLVKPDDIEDEWALSMFDVAMWLGV